MYTVFMSCGGQDPEIDEIPEWVKSVRLEDICVVDIDKVPTIKGNGLSSSIKKGENYFLALREQFEEGDIVCFKGEKG